MLELYTAECRRFARWAIGVAALHLAGLLILHWLFPFLRDDEEISTVAGFVYAITGGVFGFYQAAAYARVNHWIALLHRPLAPWRIMAGVVGAGATVALLVVMLPLLLYTASLLMQVGSVVDARHWALVGSAGSIGLVGFLTGSYVALAPRRYGWTAVVAVFIMIISSTATGLVAPLFYAGAALVVGLLVVGAFKPDRTLAPANPALLAATSSVAALTLFFLLLGGSGLSYQLTLIALQRNPLVNMPPPGGLVEASRADSGELIAAALATARGREAAEIRAALPGVEAKRLPIALNWLPTRGDLTNAGPIRFVDPRRSIEWAFSHDANAFYGVRLKDRRPAGELRPADGFAVPPLLLGDGLMIAGGDLYRLNPARGTLDRVFRLPRGERIVARPVRAGEVVAILGERALHLVDKAVLDSGRASRPDIAVPLPGMIGDLRRLDLAPLLDRTIVSFFFGRDSIEGPSRAWQQIVSVRPDGPVRTLARRSFGPEFSNVLRFRAYWLSPAIHAAAAAAGNIGAADAPVLRRAVIVVPRGIWIGAGLLSLAAALCAAVLSYRRRLGSRTTAVWTLATLVLGVPMLIALWMVGKKRRLTA